MFIKAKTLTIETAAKVQLLEEGRLVLGQFQRSVFAELDGPRPRSLRMQFMGEGAELPAHRVRGWEHASILELPRNGGLG